MQNDEEMRLMQQMVGQDRASPGNMVAHFSMEPVEISEKSKEAGRPIYEEQEFITIHIPGDRHNVIFRPVRNVDKVQFGEKYRAFRANKEQPESGTPLSTLPFMSKAQVLELNYFGVKTAEQLVKMSDGNGQQIIGFSQLKSRVQTFLDAANGAAPALKLQAELEKRDNAMASMQATIDEQARLLKEIQAARKAKE